MKMRTFRHLRTLTSKLSCRIRQKRLLRQLTEKYGITNINSLIQYLEMLNLTGIMSNPELIKSFMKSKESEVKQNGKSTK